MRLLIMIALALSAYAQSTGAKVAFESPSEALRPKINGEQFPGGVVWIVGQGPEGKMERLPPSHVFRSGESIQLKIRPEINGYLTLYVSDDALTYISAFPHKRFYGGSPKIRKGEELTIPLTFDNKPGNTKLYLAALDENADATLLNPLKAPAPTAPSYDALMKYLDPKGGGKGIQVPDPASAVPLGLTNTKGILWSRFELKNQ